MIIRLLDKKNKKIIYKDLEAYILCVVAGEMPASWPIEALKAQAIASRSYAYYALFHPRHSLESADVCTSPGHCQAYYTGEVLDRVQKAVESTSGSIIKRNGIVVPTYYGACCGGSTKNSEDVWIQKLSHIRGVSCPCDGVVRGHRLGLCQEGARIMAENGQSHVEILHHYYTGVDIESI